VFTLKRLQRKNDEFVEASRHETHDDDDDDDDEIGEYVTGKFQLYRLNHAMIVKLYHP